MKTIIENYVNNAGDNVQQLVAAVNGQKALKKIEDSVRAEATKEVENYLRSKQGGYDYSHKGNLDWKGDTIIVKHKVTYTWDNYRKTAKPEDQKTAAELELERKVDEALNLRLFRKQLLDSAQDAANIASSSLKAARTNFNETEKALAKLLPNSKCIHDELQIAVP